MKYVKALIYILIYGGFVMPFTLGDIHKKQILWAPVKMLRWWIVWVEAFCWLLISVIESIFSEDKWAFEMAASADQHASAVLGFNKDHTISGILGDYKDAKIATKGMLKFCEALSLFDKNSGCHCLNSRGH